MQLYQRGAKIDSGAFIKQNMPASFHNQRSSITALLTLLIIIYLIVGVPTLFGIQSLVEITISNLIIYPLLLLFIAIFSLNHTVFFESLVHKFFYLYFLFLLIATLFAKTIFTDVRTQIITLGMSFIWLSSFISIYYSIRSLSQYNVIMKLLDMVGTGIAISVFLSYVGPEYLGFSFGEIYYGQQTRAFGPFGDQVGFILGYFALRNFAHAKWLKTILHFIAIFFTGTRGAILSVFIGTLWLIIQLSINKRNSEINLYRVAFGIFSVTIGAFSFFSSSYGESIFNRFWSDESTVARQTAIVFGMRVYLDHPVLGVGFLGFNRLGNAYNFYQNFAFGSDAQRGMFTAQNQYIQAATDAGTFGLLLLLLFLLTLIRELHQGRHLLNGSYYLDVTSILSWVVAMAIGNQAAVWILPANITGYMFFLINGLTLGLLRLHKQGSVAVKSNYLL